jgi:hypothetical protein
MAGKKTSALNMLMGGQNSNKFGAFGQQKVTASFAGNVVGKKSFGSFNQQSSGFGNMRAAETVMSATTGPWDQETVEKLEAKSKHQRLTHLEE